MVDIVPIVLPTMGSGIPLWVLRAGGAVAAVDLNFATGQYYGGSLPSLLTNTNSTGGYVTNANGSLTLIPPNTLRIGTGLLVEQGSTNLLLQSQALATSPWGNGGITGTTVTNNAATAPDGTATATSLTPTLQFGGVEQSITTGISAATAYTVSGYVKNLSGNAISLNFQDTISGTPQGNNLLSIPFASNWTRFSLTHTTVASTNGINIILQDRNTSGFGTFLLWGIQVEQLAFPTSYIVTTAATAARSADNVATASALSAVLAASAGSTFMSWSVLPAVPSGGVILLQDGSSRQFASIANGFPQNVNMWNGAVSLGASFPSGNSTTVPFKTASAWSAAGRSVVVNNGTVAHDTNVMPAGSGNSIVGSTGSANFVNSVLARLSVFTSAVLAPTQ